MNHVYFGSKMVPLAPRERWVRDLIQTDVMFQDWEMYAWGDFRHHCPHETPDEIHQTRPNVSGTIFNRRNLVCRDCTAVMPEDAKKHFYATFRICTMGHTPPAEFYIGNSLIVPGAFIRIHPRTPTINIV